MTYQCTLQGRSMGAGATITFAQVANKFIDKVIGPIKEAVSIIPPFANLVNGFIEKFKPFVIPIVIKQLELKIMKEADIKTKAGDPRILNTANLATTICGSVGQEVTRNGWITDETILTVLFGSGQTSGFSDGLLYGIVLSAMNDVIKEITGIPPTTPDPETMNWAEPAEDVLKWGKMPKGNWTNKLIWGPYANLSEMISAMDEANYNNYYKSQYPDRDKYFATWTEFKTLPMSTRGTWPAYLAGHYATASSVGPGASGGMGGNLLLYGAIGVAALILLKK